MFQRPFDSLLTFCQKLGRFKGTKVREPDFWLNCYERGGPVSILHNWLTWKYISLVHQSKMFQRPFKSLITFCKKLGLCKGTKVREPDFWLDRYTRGVLGQFCIIGSYESTFYLRTAAFYRSKISCLVKKLLSFEGWWSDHILIEIYMEFGQNFIFLVLIFLLF